MSEITYTGDDINDLANICSCGWGICPANAVKEVALNADVVLNARSGKEVIRNCVEFIVKYNNRFK